MINEPSEFGTETMLNINEAETQLSHKPRSEFGTETMLNTNKPETHLTHKPRYKFVTQTMVKHVFYTFCRINIKLQ